jgi:hypothetical protein
MLSAMCATLPVRASSAQSWAATASATRGSADAGEDGVTWSMGRPLAWSDFLAEPPQTGQEGALTSYSLRYRTSCRGRKFEFSVDAVFLPGASWVKPTVLADPRLERATLQHEQTHFDLTEAFARQIRRGFATAAEPCGKGADAATAAADRLIAREADVQSEYDRESRHGLDADGQRLWQTRVSAMLAELGSYR